MVDEDKRYEVVVKEFGNGAHITVPKEWIGQIAQVELVGPYCPPLFDNVATGRNVMMDIQVNDDELACENGLSDTSVTVTGEVIEFNNDFSNDNSEMKSEILIDAENQFYRVTVRRDAGDDGWQDSEYEVERDMDTDEFTDSDRIISLEQSGMWKPVGVVEGFGVKQSV